MRPMVACYDTSAHTHVQMPAQFLILFGSIVTSPLHEHDESYFFNVVGTEPAIALAWHATVSLAKQSVLNASMLFQKNQQH